jgi:prepilin-type N-terminal cleavage/methylation domain-containing protein
MTGRLPRRSGGNAAFTLLEVLIAVAILAVVAASLLAMRLDAVRTERLQREHVELTQLIRSEAEALRVGASAPGTCSGVTDVHRDAGFVCEVELRCGFSADACSASSGGLRAYVIRAATPRGTALAVPLLFREDATRAIAAQR